MQAHTIESLDLALRAGLIALNLFVAAVLLREHPRHVAARLGAALAVGVAAYALQSMAGFANPLLGWQAPVLALSAGNAVVFWLFSRAIFDDEFELRPWHGVVWLALAMAPIVNCFMLLPSHHVSAQMLGNGITLATLGFSMLAVGRSVATWRDDLVERRRRLRVFIVAGGAAYTAVAGFVRLGTDRGVMIGFAGVMDMLALGAIVVVVAWQLVRVSERGMFGRVAHESPVMPEPRQVATESTGSVDERRAGDAVSEAASPPPLELERAHEAACEAPPAPRPDAGPADAALVARLERLMTIERFHQEDDASIGTLADRLDMPEHKLRKLINRRLGYRNFNAFLNHYRLADAKAALADPAQSDIPVLTIAMEAGFQSLGPFNRAFKADTRLTPTEFRRLAGQAEPAESRMPLADFEIG